MEFYIKPEHLEFIGKLLLILIAAAIVVSKVIDLGKKTGKIDPENAGEWNQAVSFAVSIILFILKWIGVDGQVPAAEALGAEIAAILVTTYSVAAVAKLVHKLVNWLEGRKRIDVSPKADTPAATPVG
jgi:hypothetical protein